MEKWGTGQRQRKPELEEHTEAIREITASRQKQTERNLVCREPMPFPQLIPSSLQLAKLKQGHLEFKHPTFDEYPLIQDVSSNGKM